jgi:hypothetical protein
MALGCIVANVLARFTIAMVFSDGTPCETSLALRSPDRHCASAVSRLLWNAGVVRTEASPRPMRHTRLACASRPGAESLTDGPGVEQSARVSFLTWQVIAAAASVPRLGLSKPNGPRIKIFFIAVVFD